VQAEIAAAVDFIELQKQDAILGVIQAWLEGADVIPDNNALRTFEPEVQQLWAQREPRDYKRNIVSQIRATRRVFAILTNCGTASFAYNFFGCRPCGSN